LRNPVELAHRAQTLALLSARRFRFGIGSGSTKHDFDVVQADYEKRFRTLPVSLDIMRRVWNGEAVFGPVVPVWPGTEGGPPVLLGAWRSQRWIDLAARQCQGWIASGIYSAWEDLATGVRMYRDAGGTRAVLANVYADLRPDAAADPRYGAAKITLVGTKAEARDRLRRLQDIGFDDVLLVPPFDAFDQLDALRELASPFA
jgi:alkanesulfonate monooxygenase SsuD/methylene tetrahydromethanopterin reductase-like flavin-dependent oxidoreductase (luciferase family)